MKSPKTEKEMILCKEKRPFPFRKEEFLIVFHYFKSIDSKNHL